MVDNDSLIKANYARSLLRVARNSPKDDALKLIESLAREVPNRDTKLEIANAHRSATAAFTQLATSIRVSALTVEVQWKRAEAAIYEWLALVK
jgi:hypothetical protein